MQDFEVNTMKQLKKGILFLFIFFLLLGACSQIISRILPGCRGSVYGRDRVYAGISTEKKNSLDIIFLGDSESYTAFSPMDLWSQHGITSYNCGQSAQRIQETYYVLKTAFETQSPRLVVLETNVMFRNPGISENVLLSVGEPLRFYFPVLRYHNLWKTAFENDRTDPDTYKGFPVRQSRNPYIGPKDYMKKTDARKKMPEPIPFYMDQIIRLCEKNHASLLLVSSPSPVNYSYKAHNTLEAYARVHGLPYLDLNLEGQLQIDWEKDTFDEGDHLNFSGAEKVTAFLGKYLKEHYSLPDHRGESEYEKWNIMLNQYQTSILDSSGSNM